MVATGRSDFPNQINNVLAFPGVFRGLLDAQATEITDEMLLAAAEAIANVVSPDQLNASYIVPSVFDENVSKAVARAVVEASRSRCPDRRRRQGIGADVSAPRCCPARAPAGRCARAGRSARARAGLTHVDATGAARMVDVSAKQPSARTALATGVLRTTAEVTRVAAGRRPPQG